MKRYQKAGLGLFSALLFLGAFEVLLQLTEIPEKGLYKGDPSTLWWLKPNLDREVAGSDGSFRLRTSSQGFRDFDPPESGEWTLFLGCSTTFGWGVDSDKSWVSQLAKTRGEVLVNGGQPGWSTHQAAMGLDSWSKLKPSRVVISFLVRDAQLGLREDHLAEPSPFWSRLQVFRLLNKKMPTNKSFTGTTPRVSPERYRANLKGITALFEKSKVQYLIFPQLNPDEAWVDILREFGAIQPPPFQDGDFLKDKLHLNETGSIKLSKFMDSQR